MAENIYHYTKEPAQYAPDKFSIVGVFNNSPDNGLYYGNSEYSIDESDIDVANNKIIITDDDAALQDFLGGIDEQIGPRRKYKSKEKKYDRVMKFSDISDEVLYGQSDIIKGGADEYLLATYLDSVNEDNIADNNEINDYYISDKINDVSTEDMNINQWLI